MANPTPWRAGSWRGTWRSAGQPVLHTFLTALLSEHPHARASHVLAAVRARFGADEAVTLPAARSLQRWLTRWRMAYRQLHTALAADPAAWKSRHLAAFGSASVEVTAVNQLWEMDSTIADVMLADGRHTLIGVIDVHSHRARLLASRTSRATAIACLLRRALLEWGMPEQIRTDNGPDYLSRHVRRPQPDAGNAPHGSPAAPRWPGWYHSRSEPTWQ